jgi:hypothetical protein
MPARHRWRVRRTPGPVGHERPGEYSEEGACRDLAATLGVSPAVAALVAEVIHDAVVRALEIMREGGG